MTDDWFKAEKIRFFKEERKDLLKGTPKKDGSGKGIRLNKGRGGCPPSKQEKFGKGMSEFSPERALKLTGQMALVGAGVLVGTKLLGDIANA